MKRLIIFLILATFFAVSCSSSKKAENNDTDILQDEDEISGEDADEDIAEADEEEKEDDDDRDGSANQNQCEQNPCGNFANTDGSCTVKKDGSFECGCLEGYLWNGSKCVDPCAGISCGEIEHGAGTCTPDSAFMFRCGCVEGYYWWGNKKQCLAKKPALENICTGQNKCYDNGREIPCPAENEEFFGQDAHSAQLGYCIPQSFSIDYSVEEEPVVVDNNTGNMWQGIIAPLLTRYYDGAGKYCNALNYGGYDDWTLPSIEDFMTIADYGKYDPAVNTAYFSDAGSFWTSSDGYNTYSLGPSPNSFNTCGYTAIFDFKEPSTFSVATYEYSNYNSDNSYSYKFNIRCVRKNGVTATPYYFISKTFGGSVTWNNYNDLIFTEKTGTELSWSEALKYCSEIDYAGISDWRLPNVK